MTLIRSQICRTLSIVLRHAVRVHKTTLWSSGVQWVSEGDCSYTEMLFWSDVYKHFHLPLSLALLYL